MTAKALFLVVVLSLVLVGYAAAQGQAAQVPSGISDLLDATQTMLSSLDLRAKNAKTSRVKGNSITISGSKIVFAQSDKPTLVATITSLIQNSEPSVVGDKLLTNTILAVLDAKGTNVITKQIEETIKCRAQNAKLGECVATLVDVVTNTAKHEIEDGGHE